MLKIPYARQSISQTDIKKINLTLKSNFLTTGPKTLEFENKLSEYSGAKFSIALNSATSALHISCLSLGLKKNDYLWTTPISFAASSNCALYCGAKVDFIDIDDDTFNISIQKLEKKLKFTSKKKLPKIVVIVHLSGHPVDLKKVKQLSIKYNFKIIEDASHAVGSTFKGMKIGNCKYSDICVYSFHPVKIITTGEGGAIFTNSKKIYNTASILRSHGIKKEIYQKNNPWFYDQKLLGYNYRMNDMEATLGISQLSRLDKFINQRNKIAEIYKKYLNQNKIKFQLLIPDSKSSMHLFIIRVNKNIRMKIYNSLKKNGINTNLHYKPIYRHSFYKKYNFNKNNFQNSEKYYKEAITLPLYYDLKKVHQMKIIKIINKVLNKI